MKTRETILFVATPCYGGLVNERYAQSLVQLVSQGMQLGIKIGYFTRSNESLITRARNDLVATFLTTPATHLMFIDADINFNASDVFKMITANKDIITGAYPTKTINWENMSSKGRTEIEELQKNSIRYASGLKDSKRTPDGLYEVKDGATGFMLIKREVIERMIKHYPETRYMPEVFDDASQVGVEKYALFDTMIENGRYLSEDYTFCRRWQNMGGKIYVDPSIVLDHVGTYTFKGNSIQ
jgi:hypothetical protein